MSKYLETAPTGIILMRVRLATGIFHLPERRFVANNGLEGLAAAHGFTFADVLSIRPVEVTPEEYATMAEWEPAPVE